MRALTVIVALGLTACGPFDGLFPLSGPARVVGTLVNFDGTAPSAARVHLVNDAGTIVASTDSRVGGAFELTAPSGGRWSFVAVGADGLVAQGSWSLQPAGTTDVGHVFLLSAAEAPTLVDLRGLGLEEQRTSFATGVTSSITLSSGGPIVGTEAGVMRVPSVGAPVTVATDPRADIGLSDTVFEQYGLVGCGWVTGWALSVTNDQGYRIMNTFVLFDLERGKELLRVPVHSELNKPRLAGAGCSERSATVVLGNRDGEGSLVALHFPRGADAPLEMALGPVDVSSSPFVFVASDFVEVGQSEFGRLWRFDEAAPVDRPPGELFLGLFGDEWLVIKEGDAPSWVARRRDTLAERVLLACQSWSDGCTAAWNSNTGTLLTQHGGVGAEPLTATRIDVATGAVTAIPLSGEAAALVERCSLRVNGSTSGCEVDSSGLLTERAPPDPLSGPGFVVDLLTGHAWTFPWPDTTSWARAVRSPRGDVVVTVTSQQLADTAMYTGVQGQPLRRRTFMPSYRLSFVFDDAGVWYVRRDPRTSVNQLYFLEDDVR